MYNIYISFHGLSIKVPKHLFHIISIFSLSIEYILSGEKMNNICTFQRLNDTLMFPMNNHFLCAG